jgi:cytochrome c oxidase assembly protein subunit 15
MSVPRASPRAFKGLALVALVWQVVIVMTGSTTRLTGSGLGCPTWPRCDEYFLVEEWEFHAVMELGNRLTSLPVVLSVLAVLAAAYLRAPRRADMQLLAWGLVAGTAAQVVLGGITVLTRLRPETVMAHFLMSVLLLWCATVLHHRAGRPETPPVPVVARRELLFARVVFAVAGLVVLTGTFVTAAGPHGGAEGIERLGVYLPLAVRVHAFSAVVLLVLTIVMLALLRSSRAPWRVRRRAMVLAGIIASQAFVGYVQYLTGIPAVIVGVHIAGTMAVWIALVRFYCGLHERVAEELALGREPVVAIMPSAPRPAGAATTL